MMGIDMPDKKEQRDEALMVKFMTTLDGACLELSCEAGRIASIALVARMSKFDCNKYGNRFYDVLHVIQDLSDQLAEDLYAVSVVLAMINGMDESALVCRKLPDDTKVQS